MKTEMTKEQRLNFLLTPYRFASKLLESNIRGEHQLSFYANEEALRGSDDGEPIPFKIKAYHMSFIEWLMLKAALKQDRKERIKQYPDPDIPYYEFTLMDEKELNGLFIPESASPYPEVSYSNENISGNWYHDDQDVGSTAHDLYFFYIEDIDKIGIVNSSAICL